MPSFLTRCVVPLAVLVAISGNALAAERPSRSTGLNRITNPFAVSIYSRLSSNPFGLPALSPTPLKAPTIETISNPVSAAPVMAQEPVETLDAFEPTPALMVVRPPYVAPVRSPFRPPPRPPFIP